MRGWRCVHCGHAVDPLIAANHCLNALTMVALPQEEPESKGAEVHLEADRMTRVPRSEERVVDARSTKPWSANLCHRPTKQRSVPGTSSGLEIERSIWTTWHRLNWGVGTMARSPTSMLTPWPDSP